MDISYFSYITGLASLFGFIAQVLDWFPRHKEIRKYGVTLVFGFFIGSLSVVFNAASITFNINVTGYVLLLSLLGLVTFFFVVTGLLTSDITKRSELYNISSVSCGIFMFVLIFGSIPSMENESVNIKNEKSKLTISELIYLSKQAEKRADYDRALMHLQSIKNRIGTDDSRQKDLNKKIESIKDAQI